MGKYGDGIMKLSSCQSIRVGGTSLSGRGSMQSSASPRQTSMSPDIALPGEIALKQYGWATPLRWHMSGHFDQKGKFLYIGDGDTRWAATEALSRRAACGFCF